MISIDQVNLVFVSTRHQKDDTSTSGFALQNRHDQIQNVQKSPSKFSNSFLGFKKTSMFNKTVVSSQSPIKENISNTSSKSNEIEVNKSKPVVFKSKFAGFSILKKAAKASPPKMQVNKQIDGVKNTSRPLVASIPKMPIRQSDIRPAIQSNTTTNEIQQVAYTPTPVETKTNKFSCISSDNSFLSDPIDYSYEEEDISMKDKEFDKSEKDLYAFVKYWNEYFDKINEDMKNLKVNLCMLNSQLICSFDPTIHLILQEIEKRSDELESLLKQT